MPKAKGETSLGLEPNVAGLLCYALTWLTGIIFFIMEKNKFVRFHAVQSIIVFGAVTVAWFVLFILSWIPWIGILFWIIGWLLWAFAFILWIVLMLKAYQGAKFKLPIAGDIAEKQSR